MSNSDMKKDIRYTVFVNSSMDDKVEHIARLMGLSKPEVVRYFIAQGCLGMETSVNLIRENADKIISGTTNK